MTCIERCGPWLTHGGFSRSGRSPASPPQGGLAAWLPPQSGSGPDYGRLSPGGSGELELRGARGFIREVLDRPWESIMATVPFASETLCTAMLTTMWEEFCIPCVDAAAGHRPPNEEGMFYDRLNRPSNRELLRDARQRLQEQRQSQQQRDTALVACRVGSGAVFTRSLEENIWRRFIMMLLPNDVKSMICTKIFL